MVLTFHRDQPHLFFEVHVKVQRAPPATQPEHTESTDHTTLPQDEATIPPPTAAPEEIEYMFVVEVNAPSNETTAPSNPPQTEFYIDPSLYEEYLDAGAYELGGEYHNRHLFSIEEEELQKERCDEQVSNALRLRESRCEQWVQRYKRAEVEKRAAEKRKARLKDAEIEEKLKRMTKQLKPEDFEAVEMYPWEALGIEAQSRAGGRKLLDAFGDSLK